MNIEINDRTHDWIREQSGDLTISAPMFGGG